MEVKKTTAAYRRYYAKHRDELCQRMRERDAKRREELKTHLAQHPEDVAKEREKMREKYHRRINKKVKTQINLWLADKHISDSFKDFLRKNVLAADAYKSLTPKTLNALAELPIFKMVAEPISTSDIEDGIGSVASFDGARHNSETETDEGEEIKYEDDESDEDIELINSIRIPTY